MNCIKFCACMIGGVLLLGSLCFLASLIVSDKYLILISFLIVYFGGECVGKWVARRDFMKDEANLRS